MDPASDNNFRSIQRKKIFRGNLLRKTDNEVNHTKLFLMQAFFFKYKVTMLLPNFSNKLFQKLIIKYYLKIMYN